MTNQNNEFGKSPVKLSSPTQIWIDDVNQNNELDELDEIVRRIHFSQASFNELTKEELYEDIGDDCLRVINKGKKAIQALYAPVAIQNNELDEILDIPNILRMVKEKGGDVTDPDRHIQLRVVFYDGQHETYPITLSYDLVKQAIQALYAPKPVENGELDLYRALQTLKDQDDNYVLSTISFSSQYGLQRLIEFIEARLAQEKAKWVSQMLSKCNEKEIVLMGTECKYCGDYVDYCNCHKIRQNQRDEIRQALAKLLDKVKYHE